LQEGAVALNIESDFFDALGVGALEGVGDAEEGGELGDSQAVFVRELSVVFVRGIRGGATMVAGDEGDEGFFVMGESENL